MFIKFESFVGDFCLLTHLDADIVHSTSDCKALLLWSPVIGLKFGTKAETVHLTSDMFHSKRKRCINRMIYLTNGSLQWKAPSEAIEREWALK